MSQAATAGSRHGRLVLVAMIFAVAMMFIDQTIVALAVPDLQSDLSLSATATQWIVNGYLLSLAALFLLGGRMADVLGHVRMVVVGIVGFAACSALCGATPTGEAGEAWIIAFRVLQGAFAAILFPAALALVVRAFPVHERGKALAAFFGITGGLTAVGPLAGGYLTEWTWRAIFWINIPVAVIALVLTARARPGDSRQGGAIDFRGALLAALGLGLVVLGLQQAGVWGWADARTIGAIVVGLAVMAAFVAFELGQREPLVQLRIFSQRAFAFDNLVLGLMSAVFVPFFFFASVYAQAALGQSTTDAGFFLLVFFGGFAAAAQWGGRIVDARGPRPAVVMGCALAAVGFYLWGTQLPDLRFDDQWYFVAMAGAGLGLVLGPASTDAINRAIGASYGEVTGVTQTVRNIGASLGLAIMGSVFIAQNVDRVTATLTREGVPAAEAERVAHTVTSPEGHQAAAGMGSGRAAEQIVHRIQVDIAHSTQTVVWIMAGIMAAAFVIARLGLEPGRAVDPEAPAEPPRSELTTA